MCYCICAAQTRAHAADEAVRRLLDTGLLFEGDRDQVAAVLGAAGVRFHNSKARYVVDARQLLLGDGGTTLKKLPSDPHLSREYLADNVPGLGMKEASHFLRNIGYKKLAIIDRHVLRTMHQLGTISRLPKTVTRRRYLELERLFFRLARRIGMPPEALDLVMWSKATGEVFK